LEEAGDRQLGDHLDPPPPSPELLLFPAAKAGETVIIMITVPKSRFFMTLSLRPLSSPFTKLSGLSRILVHRLTIILKRCGGKMGDAMASQSSIELPSPTEYREFAVECLRWADRVPWPEQRITLIEIASEWMHTALVLEYNQAQNVPCRLPPSTARPATAREPAGGSSPRPAPQAAPAQSAAPVAS